MKSAEPELVFTRIVDAPRRSGEEEEANEKIGVELQ